MPDAVATLEATRPVAVSHVDRGIEAYIARCRGRIPSFVEHNFSLIRMLCDKPERRALWEGKADSYGSASEADLALVGHLAFFTGC